ncbi:hypothetical protein DICA3_D05446 [Diutina catenulata]
MANTSTSVPKSTIPSPKPIITMVVFMLGWSIWDKFVASTIIHLIVWGYYLIIRNEEDDDYDDLTSLATQKWDAHEAEQWENTQRKLRNIFGDLNWACRVPAPDHEESQS